MKKLLLLVLFIFPTISYSNFYDGIWKVTDVVGESWLSINKRHIGKTQEFYKGYADGMFFTCNYKGLVTTSDSDSSAVIGAIRPNHAHIETSLLNFCIFLLAILRSYGAKWFPLSRGSVFNAYPPNITCRSWPSIKY